MNIKDFLSPTDVTIDVAVLVSTVIYPPRPVLTVCCDGGFMMNSREMETAVRLHLNVVALVLQDNMFANTSYAIV